VGGVRVSMDALLAGGLRVSIVDVLVGGDIGFGLILPLLGGGDGT
jgi:hypothetical protein